MQERESMLCSISDLTGYKIVGTNGEVGSITDFYFDDQSWTVRYLVVDTGGWLSVNKVLISPMAIEKADWEDKKVYLSLSKKQIENSPGIATEVPVSRKYEKEYYEYYGWLPYWNGTGLWGVAQYPVAFPVSNTSTSVGLTQDDVAKDEDSGSHHLRRTREVIGYTVQGTDDTVGNIRDFIVKDKSWEMFWIVIDTSPWWFGGNVLVHTGSIREISWPDRTVYVNLTRDEVKNGPEWDKRTPVSAEYNDLLLDYYKQGRAA